jgi:hypothetical protein
LNAYVGRWLLHCSKFIALQQERIEEQRAWALAIGAQGGDERP